MTETFEFDREAIKTLMEKAAFSLTYEPVQIQLREPKNKSFAGQVFRAKNGLLTIAIKPDLEMEVFYKVFLHEIGHISLGHCNDLLPIDLPTETSLTYLAYGPSLTPTQAERKEHREKPEESGADDFANSIDGVAKEYARLWFQSEDIEARLRALSRITISKGE